MLNRYKLEPRALGRSDYPTELPLHEVYVIAKRCAGGVVLGFEQMLIASGTSKPGTNKEKPIANVPIPTSWNHLEAGILYGLQLPLLIFKEPEVSGGVFDYGVTDVFIHTMPTEGSPPAELNDVFLKWQGDVRNTYYAI